MYVSQFEGVVFIEGQPPMAQIIKHINIEISGVFSQSQLKSLDDVKKQLCRKLKGTKGNCLVNFEYGQRSSFMATLTGIDNVSWHGSADIALMEPGDLQNLIGQDPR